MLAWTESFFLPACNAIGVALVVAAALVFYSNRRFQRQAVRTAGTVVRLEESITDETTLYRTVAQFQDTTGKTHEVCATAGSNPAAHRVGQPVTVLYPPNAPGEARIDSGADGWFGVLVLLMLGIGFLLVPQLARERTENAAPPPKSATPKP